MLDQAALHVRGAAADDPAVAALRLELRAALRRDDVEVPVEVDELARRRRRCRARSRGSSSAPAAELDQLGAKPEPLHRVAQHAPRSGRARGPAGSRSGSRRAPRAAPPSRPPARRATPAPRAAPSAGGYGSRINWLTLKAAPSGSASTARRNGPASAGGSSTPPAALLGGRRGRVGVGDPEVDRPAAGPVAAGQHRCDHVPRDGLLGLAADEARKPEQRDRAAGLGLPAEQRAVEARGGVLVLSLQSAHRPRAGLVDQLGPAAGQRLPGAEHGAARIGEHREAPGRRHVHRPGDQRPAGFGDARGGGLRAVDAHVGDPCRLDVRPGRRARADAGDLAAAEPRDGEADLGIGLERPAEHRAIEVHRRGDVGGQAGDRTGHAVGESVSLAHRRTISFTWRSVVATTYVR